MSRTSLLALGFVAISGVAVPTVLGQSEPALAETRIDCNAAGADFLMTNEAVFEESLPKDVDPNAQRPSSRLSMVDPEQFTDGNSNNGDPLKYTTLLQTVHPQVPEADRADNQIPDFIFANQVGVADDGDTVYFTAVYDPTEYDEATYKQHPGRRTAIFQYKLSTGKWRAFDLPAGPNDGTGIKGTSYRGVAGAVNLFNGKFYWGKINESVGKGKVYTIHMFDPELIDQEGVDPFRLDAFEILLPEPDGTGAEIITTTIGGNGDFAFTDTGGLTIIASDNKFSTYSVYNLDAASIPNDFPPEGEEIKRATAAHQRSDFVGDQNNRLFNGIIYGSDGFLYTSGNIGIERFNSSAQSQGYRDDSSPTDIGNCVSPPVITLQKDLPKGRVLATDEFEIAMTDPSATVTKGITVNDPDQPTGLQDPLVTLITDFGQTVTITEEASAPKDSPEGTLPTTDLRDYKTSWSCLNEKTQEVKTGTIDPINGEYQFKVEMPDEVGANISCTWINEAAPRPPGSGTVVKSSDPVSETTVTPGQKIDYTLTFTADNVGPLALPWDVDYTDDISGVLDDAEITSAPIVTGDGLTVSAIDADGKFTITGQLQPGATATVTYSAVVDNPVEGDNELLNFVFKSTEQPPTVCEPTNTLCTRHPVPQLVVSKTSDPVTGSVVDEGDKITYTIDFDNSAGKAPVSVDYTDDISDVLDDATITSDPVVNGDGLTASAVVDSVFTITGDLAAGATAQVVYEVTVNTPDEGDHILTNYVFETGDDKPSECLLSNPLCTEHKVPGLSVSKSANPVSGTTVVPDQRIDYAITFDNTLGAASAPVDYTDDISDVLDDATVVEAPAADGNLTVGAIDADGKFTVTGEVAAGQKVTVTYSVVVNNPDQGNHELLNFVFPSTSTPPEVCEAANPLCTEHPVPELVVEKSSDPVTGSVVDEGEKIKFTVSFSNAEGKAPAAVDYTDDISGVLDDADVTVDPAVNGDGLAVSAITNGAFTITGELAAGASATVTYEVQVKTPDDGDHVLTNYVFETGEDKPSTCLATSKLCTEHRVPGLSVSKGSDPASGTTVQPKQAVKYTLTFDNTLGAAPAPVDYTDDISGVLDDASIVDDPTATPSDLTVSAIDADGKFTVKGDLAAGAKVLVTYSVVVNDPDEGDHELLNYVFPSTTTPPTVCEAVNPLCTVHPVPELEVMKASYPPSGTVVQEGEKISYSLSFSNEKGKAAATVDWKDDISGVLDDASITLAPTSSNPALTLGELTNGVFTITGELAAGATATVTYEVQVNTPDEGDHILSNFLFEKEPPTICEDGDPLCTVHKVPGLSVSKSSYPPSGTTVEPKDRVDYTVTFDNTLGAAPADVDYTDDISGVLDDATVVADPAADVDSLDVSAISADGEFTVKGTVAAGSKGSVTYSVIVNDPDKGDHELLNYVFPSDKEPPTECLATDPLCTRHPVPELVVAKSSNPPSGTTVNEGDKIAYTLSFDNSAGKAPAKVEWKDDITGLLDDATLTVEPVVNGSGLQVGPITDGVFTITGELAAGTSATVTYEAQVNDPDEGDRVLSNFLFETEPPTICEDDDPLCTVHRVPGLSVSKSSDPASGTIVAPDDEIKYTLTFDNSIGEAPATVDYTDDISGVLDDATVTAAPAASADSLSVTEISTDGKFTITGNVPAGETITVTYTAKVNNPDTGDHQLLNFVFESTTAKPPICEATNPLCTVHPVPELVVEKSSDPVSLTVLNPGDAVKYTIGFSNTGAAPTTINYEDDISGVLDDATVTSAPVSSSDTLTVSAIENGKFTIKGELAGGASADITYEVQVNNPTTGDFTLLNYVIKAGETTPPDCVDSDKLCTKHPVNRPQTNPPPIPPKTGFGVTNAVESAVMLLIAGAALAAISRRRKLAF